MVKRVILTKEEKQKKVKATSLTGNAESLLIGRISDVIRNLYDICNDHGRKYDELCIEYNPGYGESGWLEIVGYKEESDEEYNNRIDKIKEEKRKKIEKQEKAEKKLYRELKKKYGPSRT